MEEPEYTIDQLAQLTGVTVRNIRAHQSRGLLPPPEVRGRTGYYGPDHAARLLLIREMQADGFNLAAVKRILHQARRGGAGELLSFERALRTPWEEEQPEVVRLADLAGRLGDGPPDAAAVARAVRLGLLVPLGEDRFEVPSPALVRAGEDLVALGIPLDAALDVEEVLTRHSDGIARAFVRIFMDEVWQPFEGASHDEADWVRIRETLDRLRPLALEALTATFRRSMTRAVERALQRAAAPPRRRRRPARR